MAYTRPVNPTGISTWTAHTRRNPPSSEAGVDYYCPIGTPILAAADGRVVAIGGSIHDATGRYLTIDLNDGRRVRYLHLRSYAKTAGDIVRQGAVVGYSGASGYGSEFFGASSMNDFPWGNTGGPHVHTTLWPTHAYQFGNNPTRTIDFELYVGNPAATDSTPFEEDDMFTDDDRQKLHAVYAALFGPQNLGIQKMTWQSMDGPKEAFYGLLDIDIYTQQLVKAGNDTAAAILAATTDLGGD